MELSRRNFVLGGLCGCAFCAGADPALARISPSDMKALVSRGYKPTDTDERGLWQEFGRLEEQLSSSNLLVGNPALTDYVRGVTERLLGDTAADLRIYVVHDPDF